MPHGPDTMVCSYRFLHAPDSEVPGSEGSPKLPCTGLLAHSPHHHSLLDIILDEL